MTKLFGWMEQQVTLLLPLMPSSSSTFSEVKWNSDVTFAARLFCSKMHSSWALVSVTKSFATITQKH